MKFLLYQKKLSHFNVQRNILAGLAVVFLAIIVLQTILLFFKSQRVIISPPELTQSYWVEGNRVSKSYVEEMALFFAHLLLDVTQSNILPQGEVLLRYVAPGSYGDFKNKLLSDHKKLKKQQLSLQFIPQTIDFVAPLTLDVHGFLANYVGNKRVSQVKETYRIVFSCKKGRLFLESFQTIQSEQKDHEEETF